MCVLYISKSCLPGYCVIYVPIVCDLHRLVRLLPQHNTPLAQSVSIKSSARVAECGLKVLRVATFGPSHVCWNDHVGVSRKLALTIRDNEDSYDGNDGDDFVMGGSFNDCVDIDVYK